jgi:hypothetical protein
MVQVMPLPTKQSDDGFLMFKLEDLWEIAKDWARQTGRKYNYATVEGAAPL